MKRHLRTRKILRSCGITLLIGLLLLGGIVAWQWQLVSTWAANLSAIFAQPEYASGLETPEQVRQYLDEQGAHVALASYTVAPDGTPRDDGTALFHHADTPLPLASTMKIVLLATYAQAVQNGTLHPDTPITLHDWERFYLPGTDGGAHAAALQAAQLATDEHGFAETPDATVPLDTLVRAMIHFSDNAATDWLLDQLGADAVQQVISTAGLTGQEPLLPISGVFLTWQNHEQPDQDVAKLDGLTALSAPERAAAARRMEARYLDPAWGDAERAWRRAGTPVSNISYQARAATALMPKGTARDYARIMAGVIRGKFLSPQASATMRRYLEWPMALPGNQQRFSAFGTKGGSVPGVLTEAMFLTAKQGDFAGQPRVVVLFMSEMPVSAWLTMSRTFGQQQFMVQLATDSAFVQQTRATFPPPSAQHTRRSAGQQLARVVVPASSN